MFVGGIWPYSVIQSADGGYVITGSITVDTLTNSQSICLIKTDSKVIDFTVKNQLQKLAKHLDTVLEI